MLLGVAGPLAPPRRGQRTKQKREVLGMWRRTGTLEKLESLPPGLTLGLEALL